MKINKYIDHTLLKATATKQDIEQLCKEAIQYQFCAVCVNGSYVATAKELLKDTSVKVAAVIGFPLGAMSTESKIFEAKNCIQNGADEIDMVIQIGWAKSGEFDAIEKEVSAVKQSMGNKVLKVIFENAYLTDQEIIAVAKACERAGADFIKTSTGFGTGGATTKDVKLMKQSVSDSIHIKAAGGIRDIETAKQYIALGVKRLGTSSGVALVTTGTSDDQSY